jgi:hypothetical protein
MEDIIMLLAALATIVSLILQIIDFILERRRRRK